MRRSVGLVDQRANRFLDCVSQGHAEPGLADNPTVLRSTLNREGGLRAGHYAVLNAVIGSAELSSEADSVGLLGNLRADHGAELVASVGKRDHIHGGCPSL